MPKSTPLTSANAPSTPVLIGRRTACELLEVSDATLRRLEARGKLHRVDMGLRKPLYRYRDVVALADSPDLVGAIAQMIS